MERLVVIKWGGSLAAAAASPAGGGVPPASGSDPGELVRGVRDLMAAGRRVLLVHGGGAEITRLASQLGLEARFVAGQRVTDGPTLEAVIMALAGTMSTRLVTCLVQAGIPAVGLSGVDGGLLRAEPDPAAGLGLVGEVRGVDGRPLEALFAAGLVPVVAPLALGPSGPLNVNADLAAAALAGALAAERFILLTDVAGVMVQGAVRSRVTAHEIDSLTDAGEVRGGMIPKLAACRRALAAGSAGAHILPGAAAGYLGRILAGEAPAGLGGTVVVTGEEEGGEAHVA